MNKPNKDWKLILKTNTYNGIFIKNSKEYNCLSNLYKNLEEIEKIKEYFVLLPTLTELDAKNTSEYLYKFAPLLKSFVESNDKKTLITEEGLLNILLKQEKRVNFFKFLIKQKKNIVVVCNTDYEEYVKEIQSYKYLIMSSDDWRKNTEMFERFDDIKIAISKTHNPFKDPVFAFKQYLLNN